MTNPMIVRVDQETGLGCIILRQKNRTLSGFVGVGPDHPLFGFEADAVPLDLPNSVHGGITYGRECKANRFGRRAYGEPRTKRYTVCHVTVTRKVWNYRTEQTTTDEFEYEDLWWLGFDADHVGDLVPKGYNRSARKGDVYRDQAYVYQECLALAHLTAKAERIDGNRFLQLLRCGCQCAIRRPEAPGPAMGLLADYDRGYTGEPPLVDEDGMEWDSVCEAFWVGRLGLSAIYVAALNAILEFMLSYLAIMDGRFVDPEERARIFSQVMAT
ncbi:hypothetical protein RM533_09850 [Croceicoccus sp. F390]|uniref:ApeA N-terminal domain-containing protein n=1 Tax=Croceicoccus esteveae TaxID=3075597 RepID=A0ABU2ZIR2_9SPHN|nr:hypothetical protein [Croceicoccus sp. F390]MDT0576490.1 hypothetical protein [Croceicoccus sp. F390]